MPIEIRELIIKGSLARDEDRAEEGTQVLTEADISPLKEDIIKTLNAEGVRLAPEDRRQLMDDLLREVRKMMDDRWRR
ncbi:DUF5908 family protein [Neolewinella persica]|uniref:DUF5908 family protein n=1 Tax=Neolewinella persica TaxID=70998 RepID=UPI000369953C|nr:DUF5908 family protein [Neolewinella persica]